MAGVRVGDCLPKEESAHCLPARTDKHDHRSFRFLWEDAREDDPTGRVSDHWAAYNTAVLKLQGFHAVGVIAVSTHGCTFNTKKISPTKSHALYY